MAGTRYIKEIANITDIKFIDENKDAPEEVMSAVVEGAEIYIPLDDLLDYNAELERLIKEKDRLEKEVDRVVKKLSNQGFISKAP